VLFKCGLEFYGGQYRFAVDFRTFDYRKYKTVHSDKKECETLKKHESTFQQW